MTDSSRNQGTLICIAAGVVGLVFLVGLLRGAWWSVAIPVGVLLAFVLGLTFWVGWTIATVQVEPEPDPGAPAEGATGEGPRQDGSGID
jgi:threonine/homoserine efflux transporter RhtA